MERSHFGLILAAALAFGNTSQGQPATATEYSITKHGTLEAPGIAVLLFQNHYAIGKQGGLEIIHHGERVATNGLLRVEGIAGLDAPDPASIESQANPERKELVSVVRYDELDLQYSVRVWPKDEDIRVMVELANEIPAGRAADAFFSIELYPAAYFGKSFHLGDVFGVVPRQANGPQYRGSDGALRTQPLASGRRLVLAAEDPERRIVFESYTGDLVLVDERNENRHNWLSVRSYIPSGASGIVVDLAITPSLIPNWRRKPVIAGSQVGYHPDQVKQLFIESSQGDTEPEVARLLRIEPDDGLTEVLTAKPEPWGQFLRYSYAVFDFTDVREAGMYLIRVGGQTSSPFRISRDVYRRDVWQPTLESFLPIQMCHMRVKDRWRVWHGACHLDDALQAPTSIEHVDGYRQYAETETDFEPLTHIPGLNRGGWHDAGDNDLAAGSQAMTTYYLSLAAEEFGVETDQTTVLADRLLVELHVPDGVSDIVQQVRHGVVNLLSGYRIAGHGFPGIVETAEGRRFLGDVASVTDGRPYLASLEPDEIAGNRSGAKDDRWVFTNKDTSLEYRIATALAAASRVLRGTEDALADECLETAERIWHHEQEHPPVSRPNAYVPGNPEVREVEATSEILITTGNEVYRRRLVALFPRIEENIAELGWTAARANAKINDDEFQQDLANALEEYARDLHRDLAGNPFGVPWNPRIWGIGWNIQDFAARHYYLVQTRPDLFDREIVLRVVNYVLGAHPVSSTSLVSGVGAQSLTTAYGFNMHEWSYIPGGMASGVALIRPDFPELKEPFPYLWQQTEYVIGGAATYIFVVLAADRLLNGTTE